MRLPHNSCDVSTRQRKHGRTAVLPQLASTEHHMDVGDQHADWLVEYRFSTIKKLNCAHVWEWWCLGKDRKNPATTKKSILCLHPWQTESMPQWRSATKPTKRMLSSHKSWQWLTVQPNLPRQVALDTLRLATCHITCKHIFTRQAPKKSNALYAANDRMDTRHPHMCKHQAHQQEWT